MKTKQTFMLCLAIFLLPTLAIAQSTFVGGGDNTTWEDAANWDSGLPSGVNASISGGFTVGLSSSQAINELDIVGDQNVGVATVNQTNGAVTGGGWVKIGAQAGSTGAYNLSGTSSAAGFANAYIGRNTGDGTLSTADSATFDAGIILFGEGGGTGHLVMTGGAVTSTGDLRFQGGSDAVISGGTLSAATGTVLVEDSTFDISGGTMTGSQSFIRQSTVNHTGGTINMDQWMAIGDNAGGGTATYNFSGGTLNTGIVSDALTIGENTAGVMNVSGTAMINAQSDGMIVGRNADGNGLLELVGSTASVMTADLKIGLDLTSADQGGTGTLSWIADSAGVTTIFSADNTEFGANANLLVDLTADANFASWTTTPMGTLMDIAVLIDNGAAVSGVGQFAGAAEGSLVSIGGGQSAFITYVGGDGNDIVLQAYSAIPEPASAGFLTLLLGAAAIRRRRS